MAVLTNKSIASTYKSVLSIGATTESALTSSIQQLTDGLGNGSPLSMSTTQIQFNAGSNTFKFPTTRGTSGQILKLADANGTLDWVADASGDVTKTDPIALNTIAVWNDNVDQLRSDTTMSINASHNISLLQTNSNDDNLSSYNIGGGNIANVTGSRNVGFGKQNLNAVLAGSDNTAMGDGSLEKVTSGNSNTGFGSDALGNSTDGDFNTAVGSGALNDVLTGENNTAVGYNAGVNVSTGSGNTYIGKSAGLVDVGSNNIYIGEGSGSSVASGNNNVIIGSFGGSAINGSSNNIIISDGSGNNRIQVDSGGDATFSGNVLIGTNINSDIPLQVNKETASSGTAIAFLRNTDAAGNGLVVDVTTPQNYVADFRIGNVSKMRISSGGDATFSGIVGINGSTTANVPLTATTSSGYEDVAYFKSAGTNIKARINLIPTGTGDGVVNATANDLVLQTGGADRLTISSVGTATFSGIVSINGEGFFRGDSSGNLRIQGGTTATEIRNNANNSSLLTILNGGNVGIGTTTPFGTTTNRTCLSVNGTNDASINMGVGNVQKAYFYTSATEVQLGTPASIPLQFLIGGVPRLTISSGGDASFSGSVTADGGMVINGNAGLTANNYGSGKNSSFLSSHASQPQGILIHYTAASPNGTGNLFIECKDTSTQRFTVRSNGGVANYSGNNVNLASDIRLKKDIVNLPSEWDRLKQIKVVNYRYKDSDEERVLYGAIAQQVQEIYPNLVEVTVEATKTKPEYFGLREQPFQWLTTKVLQEAMTKIESQQTIIEDLKARIEKLEG